MTSHIYEGDQLVRLRRNHGAVGRVVSVQSVAPVIAWPADTAPGALDFHLRGESAAMPGSVIEPVRDRQLHSVDAQIGARPKPGNDHTGTTGTNE